MARQQALVSDLKAECSRQKAQIEALSKDAVKESRRAETTIDQIRTDQTRALKENEEKGLRLLALEAERGKLQGEIKVLFASARVKYLFIVALFSDKRCIDGEIAEGVGSASDASS